MRPAFPFRVPRGLLAALTLILGTTACDRDLLREEAQPSGARPRRAITTTPGGAVGGINEHGTVAGSDHGSPYRWSWDGTPEPLTAPGPAFANDINDFGMVVGRLEEHTPSFVLYHAAVWGADGQILLPLDGEWSHTELVAVNDAGVAAGYGSWRDGWENAFRWSAEKGAQPLPMLVPEDGQWTYYWGWAVDINAAGDVLVGYDVGCEYDSGPVPCWSGERYWNGAAVVRASGAVVKLQWTGSDMDFRALDLNDAGMVVGTHRGQAALWSADGTLRILAPAGTARAISETGVVVGEYRVGGQTHAFRWTESGGLEDMGTLGGAGSSANDVNDSGDVTGWAHGADGGQHAFLWTRENGMQALAPEPGGGWSVGEYINNAREVAGSGEFGGQRMAARWNDQARGHPPVAHAGGPYTGRISGRRYAYTAAGSSDVDGPGLRYSWDMNGDGTLDGVTNAPLFGYTYPSGGTYTIRLEVRDERGYRDTTTTTATIAQNVAPVIANVTGMPTSRGEGLPITLTPSVSDANQAVDSSELPLLRYRWDWGDGYTSAARISAHAYADQATYTVRLIVTDAGGLADTVTRTAVIGNVAPTGRLIAPTSVGEGTPFTLQATSLRDTPPDLAAGLLVAFNCGGGFGAYGAATSIVCPARPDQGSVTVRMRVKDKDGAVSEAVRTIPVGNVAPRVTASATSATTLSAGGTFSVSATFTDVAGDAPWRYRIYWGDGSSTPLTPVAGGATITGSHAYATPGTYTVQVAVADKDGGSGRSAPITITITP